MGVIDGIVLGKEFELCACPKGDERLEEEVEEVEGDLGFERVVNVDFLGTALGVEGMCLTGVASTSSVSYTSEEEAVMVEVVVVAEAVCLERNGTCYTNISKK